MVVTWDQLTFLTPNQQQIAAKFEKIGRDLVLYEQAKGPKPDLTVVTQSQAKGAATILKTLMDLVGPAQTGIKYTNRVNEQKVVDDYQAANPPGP